MGQRDLRRLLITGAMATVAGAVRRGATRDPWLARMLARKPRMLVAVALANRMARIAWALMDEERILPRTAADRLRRQEPVRRRRDASRSEDGKGKRSTRRGRENQLFAPCLRARVDDLDPARVSPYWPAAPEMAAIR